MVMIFTWPSTTGFQRGDFTLAGVKTVLLCSSHAWKFLFRTGLIQSLFRATATLQLSVTIPGLFEPPFRKMSVAYSGNSAPP